MNIRIHLTKEEAVKIYRFLFERSIEVGVSFQPVGCTFMQDLLYPLAHNENDGCEAGRDWMFSAGGILWFLGVVKYEVKRDNYIAKGMTITQVTRRLKNAYMSLIDELVTDPFEEGDDNV